MHHPQIALCLASHDDKNIDHRTHTFAQVTKYVVTHLPLPPILSAATQMANHGKAFSAAPGQTPGTVQELATAYQALTAEMDKLRKQNKRNNKGGPNGKTKKQKSTEKSRANPNKSQRE